MYQVVFQLDYLPVVATYLTMAAIAAAILVYDRRTLGKFSTASVIGASVVYAQQLLHWPIANSEAFAGVVSFLRGLIYYR
jgi:hypothetical protein